MLKNLALLFLACFFTGIFSEYAAAKNVLRGTLLKSIGKPLPHTEIELVPVNSATFVNDGRLTTVSGAGGKFSFFGVPEGEYTLSINFGEKPTELSPYTAFFFPSTENRREAKTFRVAGNSFIENVVFRLPPALIQKKIVGKVVNSRGYPVSGAYVNLRDLKFGDVSFTFKFRTDKNGEFSLNGFKGRDYEVVVLMSAKAIHPYEPLDVIGRGKSGKFTLDDATPDITVRVKLIDEEKYWNEKNVGVFFQQRRLVNLP